MRVAVILQGEPRFCREFDLFVQNLQGADRVDYFAYLWQQSPNTSHLVGGHGHIVTAPNWQNVDLHWAVKKFQDNLPVGHQLAKITLANQDGLNFYQPTENYAVETIIPNAWKMWYSQYHSNQLRLQYQQEFNVQYDLVIRTRPDVALMQPLDLRAIKTAIDQQPNLVVQPANKCCGYGVHISDLFGISSSDNMNIYFDIFNQVINHHKRGVKFHPETMLAHHLTFNGLTYQSYGFLIEFRWLGKWRNNSTGEEFASNVVPTWDGYSYISDFGQWK
jgi:hypothetical protein